LPPQKRFKITIPGRIDPVAVARRIEVEIRIEDRIKRRYNNDATIRPLQRSPGYIFDVGNQSFGG
jgi:hypothetical protein